MRAATLAIAALLLASCAYDTSGIRFLDEDGGGVRVDGGGGCDVLGAPACSATLTCTASYWTGTMSLDARCTTAGSALTGQPCNGPGVCTPGLVCVGATQSTATCRAICTETSTCPTGLACTRTTDAPLFTSGGRSAWLCR